MGLALTEFLISNEYDTIFKDIVKERCTVLLFLLLFIYDTIQSCRVSTGFHMYSHSSGIIVE